MNSCVSVEAEEEPGPGPDGGGDGQGPAGQQQASTPASPRDPDPDQQSSSSSSMEAEEEPGPGPDGGGDGQGPAEQQQTSTPASPRDPDPDPDQQSSSSSSMVLVSQDEEEEDSMNVMVNGVSVPVYLSHTSSGSPLYIRQYPPTLEEIMVHSPQDQSANFDGFSEASGQAFEGFSEASSNFEGFSEDRLRFPHLALIQHIQSITLEDFNNIGTSDSDDTDEEPYTPLPKKKSASRSSRKSSSRARKSEGPAKLVKRSRSADTGSWKRVKQGKSPLVSSRAVAAVQTPSRRKQSQDKQAREPPQGLVLEGKKLRHLPTSKEANYIGEYCNEVGCTVNFLERMAIKRVKICNGIVCELSDFANRILWEKEFVVRWIQRLSGVRTEEPVEQSDLRSVQAVLKRRKALATIHSGNLFIKSKLKTYDDAEFVLPSIATPQTKGTENGLKSEALQSTDDEATPMMNKPDPDTEAEADEPVPLTKETQEVAVKEMGKGTSRRGAKRATHDVENEYQRHFKERRISTEANQNQEESEATERKEKAQNEEGKEAVDKTDQKTSGAVDQVEEKVKEDNEGEQTTAEIDKNIKTGRKMITRRTSILLAKEEKEKESEETKHVVEKTNDRKGSRRTSTVPQRGNKEVTKQDNKEHEPQKERDKEGEKKTADMKVRTSNRRASMLQAKLEKEETKQAVEITKRETGNDRKSNRDSDTRVKSGESQEDVDHKAEPQLSHDEKQEKLTEDNKEQTTGEASDAGKDSQVTSEPKRIGTRRASMLARQKEQEEAETEVMKPGSDISEGKGRKSKERRESTVRGEEESADETPSKKTHLTTTKQEGVEQVTADEGTETNIEGETKRERRKSRRASVVSKPEGLALNEESGRDRRSRRISMKAEDKQGERGKRSKEEDQHTGMKEELLASGGEKVKTDEEQKQVIEGIGNRRSRSRKKNVITDEAKEDKTVDKELKQTVEKTERGPARTRRSSARRASMNSASEVNEKETAAEDVTEKAETEAKKDELSKERNTKKEQETGDEENSVDSVEGLGDTNDEGGSLVDEDMQPDKDKPGSEKCKGEDRKEESDTERQTKSHDNDEASVNKQPEVSQDSKLNESFDSVEDQIILKRNKVINKDKRISRWQNRKMNKVEGETSPNKEEKRELELNLQPQDKSFNEDLEGEDSDESDGNLVIDEGDSSMLSTFSEDNLDGREGDSSMASDVSCHTPRKERRTVLDSDVTPSKGKAQRRKRRWSKGSVEDPPSGVTGSTEGKVKRVKVRESRREMRKGKPLVGQGPGSQAAAPQGASPPTTTETPAKPRGTKSPYEGTLGVSKSGRLRKPSAKGIQSIEIKCLFMQSNSGAPRPPPPLPDLKNEGKDKDWVHKGSPVKSERKEREFQVEKKSPVKHEQRKEKLSPHERKLSAKSEDGGEESSESPPGVKGKKSPKQKHRYLRGNNENISYTNKEGHLVPQFKDTDYYLGKYCEEAGVTVADLNSDAEKEVKMTFGMIKELHDFYTSRKATKTSLAIRLFKMNGKTFQDNTHLLSTVIRLTSVGTISYSDKSRLSKEFVLPVRVNYHSQEKEENVKKKTRRQTKHAVLGASPEPEMTSYSSFPSSSPSPSPSRVRSRRKRGAKPEDSGDEEYCEDAGLEGDDSLAGDGGLEGVSLAGDGGLEGVSLAGDGGLEGVSLAGEQEEDLNNEIQVTRGEKGSITRGDIVYLYTKWLRNKMSLGSTTFVTDLLRSVEQLMADRCVAPLRIPAGTLMSSSVRLHDEYKQILKISKEDAIMYLQEDWLEDIKYLLSISAPSRRNTLEAEATLAGAAEAPESPVTPVADTPTTEKPAKAKAVRHHNEAAKEDLSNFEGEPLSNTLPFKGSPNVKVSGSPHMESVGKRQGKRRSVRESLEDYEREILEELERDEMLEEEIEQDTIPLPDGVEQISVSKGEKKVEVKRKRGRPRKNEVETGKVVQKRIREKLKPVAVNFSEVEKIVDYQEVHDRAGSHLRYLVRWVGFGPEDDSWVDDKNLHCQSALRKFWKREKKAGRCDKLIEDQHQPSVPTGQSKPKSPVEKPSGAEESIIQVMVKHGSLGDSKAESAVVTKRELLTLYDGWRQENQDALVAGGSNTVNVEAFKNRVRKLMLSRNVEFHPQSLLNACFMMTLMKTRLQSKVAIDTFLDTSCLEVLESSHQQYLKRKYSEGKGCVSGESLEDQRKGILSLKNELESLRLDLTTAQKWRAVKRSQLSAVEEEVDCLETVVQIPDKKKKVMYLKEELQKLKNDIQMLEKEKQSKDPGDGDAKQDVPLFDGSSSGQENYRRNKKVVKNSLLNLNLPKTTISAVMNIVAHRQRASS